MLGVADLSDDELTAVLVKFLDEESPPLSAASIVGVLRMDMEVLAPNLGVRLSMETRAKRRPSRCCRP